MRSNPLWHHQDDCLFFQGRWTHESVSAIWQQLPKMDIAMVNVTDVEQFDSAFLTLLLQLSSSTQQPLIIRGASTAMLSLLALYNLTSVLTVEAHDHE